MQPKIIILEDEASAKKHLIKLLQTIVPQFLIDACLSTVEESINWLNSNPHPDLIFMDIHLSDGISFDILEEVSVNCPIIYTTAYDEYAIKAFKTTGIDYLLKPITDEDLEVALNKFNKSKYNDYDDWFLRNLDVLNLYREKSHFKKRFLLKLGNQLTPVKIEDIAYFYRDELVFAKCFDGRSYPMDESLNQLQKEINPMSFIRINRQLLVNINAIQKLTPFKPGQLSIGITPEYHETIYLSQERSSWLKQFLDN